MTGIYNQTYFQNNPESKEVPGILYCVILVNKDTFERECLKIGIAKGTSFKNVIKRSKGFNGYDIRIQRTYIDTLYNVWKLEQFLHEHFKEYRYAPLKKFGGHTECFEIRPEIIQAIPSRKK
jgi:hypothetical protein